MIILPAIDIKDKKCVRLIQGDFNNSTIYFEDPLQIALEWEKEGAEYLHLVDLDGAKEGYLMNKQIIQSIVKSIKIPVQLGGGIRDKDSIEELLTIGIDRIILGTVAVENVDLLKELIEVYGNERIIVSIDTKDGKAAVRGWQTISMLDSLQLCKSLKNIGIKTIVYTDISKDGMLAGPNFKIYGKLGEETGLDIIASGGISSMEDIIRLKDMNIYGAIVGKAFYDGKITLKDVIECLK